MRIKKKQSFVIILILILLQIPGCYIDDGGGEPSYMGRIYNSNDGTCDIAGKSMDFYIDGKFFATIAPGKNTLHILKGGNHSMTIKLTETGETLYDSFIFAVDGEGWWVAYKCLDGTYPQR